MQSLNTFSFSRKFPDTILLDSGNELRKSLQHDYLLQSCPTSLETHSLIRFLLLSISHLRREWRRCQVLEWVPKPNRAKKIFDLWVREMQISGLGRSSDGNVAKGNRPSCCRRPLSVRWFLNIWVVLYTLYRWKKYTLTLKDALHLQYESYTAYWWTTAEKTTFSRDWISLFLDSPSEFTSLSFSPLFLRFWKVLTWLVQSRMSSDPRAD